jgi:membrane protein
MKLSTAFKLFWEAVQGWSRDNVPRLGASLAYYSLFSIAPVLVIVIAIVGSIFGPEAVRGEIAAQVDDLVGTQGGKALQALIEAASRERGGLVATLVGTGTFLIAASGAFLELQHALNTIFRVKQAPGSKIKEYILDRIRSFGLVLSIGFLLLVSLVVSAALSAFSGWMSRGLVIDHLSYIWRAWKLVDVVISLGVITVLFALIYRYLPDARLEWRDVWFGAFVTALLFSLGKMLIGLYLGRSTVASSYGAAGSVMILLLWVYYAAQIILLGAELTRVRAKSMGREPKPTSIAKHDPDARPSERTKRP